MCTGLNLNILTRKHGIKCAPRNDFLFHRFPNGRVERSRLCVGGNRLNIWISRCLFYNFTFSQFIASSVFTKATILPFLCFYLLFWCHTYHAARCWRGARSALFVLVVWSCLRGCAVGQRYHFIFLVLRTNVFFLRTVVYIHIYYSPTFAIAHNKNSGVCVSQEQIYTQYSSSFFLCIFPPLCLLDGVELTGAEFFSTSGSKDKLENVTYEVTYVFSCLPDSFFSPACSISPSLSMFLVSLVSTMLLLSPSVLASTMNFCTQQTATWHCAVELASVKCTKLHSSSATDPILAGSPGAHTLSGGP